MQRFSWMPRRRQLLQSALAGAALAPLSPALAQPTGRVTDTVRLGYGFGGLPLIARQRGAFGQRLAQDGIKVQWVGPFPAHAPSLQAVTGGSADFSFGGSTTPALAALIAGSPLVFAQFAVSQPRTTSIITKKASGINRIEDLVGKSVAVNRSGVGEFLLVAALEKHGVDRKAVRFVYLNPPEAAPAFASGQVDAWSMWSPGVDIARTEYGGQAIFIEGRDLAFMIDFNSYLVPRRFAERNPDLVRAVNAAYRAEADWVTQNTREAETIAQREAGYSDAIREEYIAAGRRFEMHGPDDQAFVGQLQQAADWLEKRRVLPEPIRVAEHLAKL